MSTQRYNPASFRVVLKYAFLRHANSKPPKLSGNTRISGVFIVFTLLYKGNFEKMKLHAIKENHLYSKAYARGSKFVGRYVVVYVLPDYAAKKLAKANPTKKKLNRVGITVTKKLGGAVVRNRAKRIIREGYRLCDKSSPIKCGFLIVIVARGGIVKARSSDIEADLTYAFGKLSMFSR